MARNSGTPDKQRRTLLWTLVTLTALGAVLRLAPVLGAGFPLDDGGLFVKLIDAVGSHGYALPLTAEYNGLALPFAYPPLGFYVGALWNDATGMSVIDTVRVVPVAFSILAIPVAYAIYRPLLGTDARAAVATAGFALMPRSYNWLITGGGVTRSIGFLLAIVAIAGCLRLFRTRKPLPWAVLTGVALGACGLSHPQAAVFAGASTLVLVPFAPIRWRAALLRLSWAALIAAVIVSPWLVTVIGRHGIATLIGAAQAGANLGESAVLLLTFRYSDGLIELLGIVSAFGLFVCLINRQWLFPIWVALTFVVGSRAGLTYATVPLGAAIAFAMQDIVRWLRLPQPVRIRDWFASRRIVLLVSIVLVAALADALASSYSSDSPLHALSPDERAAMSWAKSNTDPAASFLVLSGEAWALDAAAEWFPVLSSRRSSATVQGTEWLGPGAFKAHERRNLWLLQCAALTQKDCIAEWDRVVEHIDFVLVTEGQGAASSGHPCCLEFGDRAVKLGGRLVFSQGDVRIVKVSEFSPAVPK